MSEFKDNVKVAIRIRPLNSKEIDENSSKCISVLESKTILIDLKPEAKSFTYDHVGSEDIPQEEVFNIVGKPITTSCLNGYNGTIFAYGQTGAGKTFTIQGEGCEEYALSVKQNYHLRGILPRCFEFLFSSISEQISKKNAQYLIKCSYLEIYQEQINDLLDQNPRNLQLREDMKKGVYVEGLIEETVSNVMETYEMLSIGSQNRHVSYTSMNKESSRSHSVFTLIIESKTSVDGLVNFRTSRFHLIDLAGSERQKATDCAGDRLKEAGMINKSLSALGNVINSLVDISEGKSRHVHYRDSKLTFLLKDSLGGNSKTFIIANVSPSSSAFAETLSTLKFAQRAKMIKNTAVVNEDITGTVNLLKFEIKKLKDELSLQKSLSVEASTSCPKCNSLMSRNMEIYSLLENARELELLVEKNTRMRVSSEKQLDQENADKEKQLKAMKALVSKIESKANHDKMVLKFRDATIAKLQNGVDCDEIENLKKENLSLREQIESNPVAARLFMENEKLKAECDRLNKESKYDSESLSGRIRESQDYTERICDSLKICAEEKSKILSLIKYQNTENDEIKAENKRIINEFEQKTSILENEKDSLISRVRGLLKLNEQRSDNLDEEENLLKAAERIEEMLKSSETSENSLSNISQKYEAQIYELQLKNNEFLNRTRELEEQVASIQQELGFNIQQIEDKDNQLKQNMQEVENLTDSCSYLTTNMETLNKILNEKSECILGHENTIKQLEDQLKEFLNSQSSQLEFENITKKVFELEKTKEKLTKRNLELQSESKKLEQLYDASRFQETIDKKHLNELYKKIGNFTNELDEIREREQILIEKIESYDIDAAKFNELLVRFNELVLEKAQQEGKLHSENANLSLKIEELLKEMEICKTELAFGFNKKKDEFEAQIGKVNSENKSLEVKVVELEEIISMINEEKTEQIEKLNSENKNLEVKALEFEKIISSLNEQKTEQIENLNSANKSLESKVIELKDIISRINEGKTEQMQKLNIENKTLVVKVLELEEIISMITEQKAEQLEKLKQLEETTSRIIEQKIEQIEKLNIENKNLEVKAIELETLNSKLKEEKIEQIQRLNSENKNLNIKVIELEEIISRINKQKKEEIEELKSENKNLNVKAIDLENIILKINEQKAAEIEKLNSENRNLNTKAIELEEIISRINEENTEQIEKLNGENKNLGVKAIELEEIISRINEQKTEEIEKLNSENKNLEVKALELEKLNSKINDQKTEQIEKLNSENTNLKVKSVEFEEIILRINEQKEEQIVKLKELEEIISRISEQNGEQIQKLNSENKHLEVKANELEKIISSINMEKTEQIERLNSENKYLEIKAIELEEMISRITEQTAEQIEQLNCKNKNLEAKAVELEEIISRITEQKAEQIEKLNNENKSLEAKAIELEEIRSTINEKKAEQIEKLDSENRNLEFKSRELEELISVINEQNNKENHEINLQLKKLMQIFISDSQLKDETSKDFIKGLSILEIFSNLELLAKDNKNKIKELKDNEDILVTEAHSMSVELEQVKGQLNDSLLIIAATEKTINSYEDPYLENCSMPSDSNLQRSLNNIFEKLTEKLKITEGLLIEKEQVANEHKEKLERDLELAKSEIDALHEENKNKMEILKTTNKNILNTRQEINMWKKCIDDKNQIIYDLRNKLNVKEEELGKISNEIKHIARAANDEKEEANENKYLKQLIQIKDKELKDLKEKGQEYYSQADEALESQRKEIEIFTKRCASLQGEVKRLKDELKISMKDRESMLEEIKKLKNDEHKSFRENEDAKKMLAQMREEKTKLLMERSKENEQKINPKNKAQDKLAQDTLLFKSQIDTLTRELRESITHNEILAKKLREINETHMKRELDRKSEEVINLTEGLSRIANCVFSLPQVNIHPEETSIVESTIKAIKALSEQLAQKESIIPKANNSHMSEVNPANQKGAFKSQLAQYYSLVNRASKSPTGQRNKSAFK